MSEKFQKDLDREVTKINNKEKNIILIYGFNGSGKTQLSVSFNNLTKNNNSGKRSGVYYNAFSEDLFDWDNNDADFKLLVKKSSLNIYLRNLKEEHVNEPLFEYKPKFDWRFEYHDDLSEGIRAVRFFPKNENVKQKSDSIKISRGEEQIFKWCFFLALFKNGGLTGEGNSLNHFFIDDPLSSLDDNNIFITISSLMKLIKKDFKSKKIIVTTHHVGFYSILFRWLTKGDEAGKYKKHICTYMLKNTDDSVKLVSPNKEPFLYHLELLKIIREAIEKDVIYKYHFVQLRLILECISSFLGTGRFSYVLEEIGISNFAERTNLINTMSHTSVFGYELIEANPEDKNTIVDIYKRIQDKYQFKLH